MPDENVKGASADAEAPNGEHEMEETTAESEVVDTTAEAAAEPAQEPKPEPAAEAAVAEPETPAAMAEVEPAQEPVPEPVAEIADESEAAEAHVEADAISASGSAKRKRKRLPRALRPQRTRRKHEPATERKAITRLPKPEHERGRRQERQGTVVSAASDKTIVVRVDVAKVHPMYKKVIRRSTKLHAHDETNQAKVGDIVRIVETRPISRMKRWRLQEIVEAAK
jgi:small subunit ribosomal protein S17